jgi:hypothetical protein
LFPTHVTVAIHATGRHPGTDKCTVLRVTTAARFIDTVTRFTGTPVVHAVTRVVYAVTRVVHAVTRVVHAVTRFINTIIRCRQRCCCSCSFSR